jgi:hypothetical protein
LSGNAGAQAKKPVDVQSGKNCWQLQKLSLPEATWQDCSSDELSANGSVCETKGVNYRMVLVGSVGENPLPETQ